MTRWTDEQARERGRELAQAWFDTSGPGIMPSGTVDRLAAVIGRALLDLKAERDAAVEEVERLKRRVASLEALIDKGTLLVERERDAARRELEALRAVVSRFVAFAEGIELVDESIDAARHALAAAPSEGEKQDDELRDLGNYDPASPDGVS